MEQNKTKEYSKEQFIEDVTEKCKELAATAFSEGYLSGVASQKQITKGFLFTIIDNLRTCTQEHPYGFSTDAEGILLHKDTEAHISDTFNIVIETLIGQMKDGCKDKELGFTADDIQECFDRGK